MPATAKMRAEGELHRGFCETVKARRIELGLTQQDMADALGVTQPAYAVIESGKISPTLKQISLIAKRLKTKPKLELVA